MPQDVFMAKKNPDRHKPARLVRIREALAAQLDILAERDATDVTELANRAVRELLTREGLWPPTDQAEDES